MTEIKRSQALGDMRSLEEVLRDWEAVIGLEVHAELTTLRTKMFCGCKLEYGADPNTHTCPVCLGLPGALPVPNKAAIESIVLAGLATNCRIEKSSMFYRKNYLYPDMSKNYQITQGPVAFCMGGYLDVETSEGSARVGITRIHMEEDAGKMVHVGGGEGRIAGASYSLVDYNRAGAPLIELVTEPDLRTPEQARLFMQKLRRIYLAIGISDCSMEKGSLRCDGNVSLRRRGSRGFGVKTELKNMNSFKSLHDGLAYEIRRQAAVLEAGGSVRQETRHWDSSEKRTVVLRVKETADDYRLFPDPDLAPFVLSDEFVARMRARLPELPDQRIERFEREYGLSSYDACQLVDDIVLADFFDECMCMANAVGGAQASSGCEKHAKVVANLLINDVAAYLHANPDVKFDETLLPAEYLLDLASLLTAGTLSSRQGREVLTIALEEGKAPSVIVDERGMRQLSDVSALEAVVDAVLAVHSDKVAAYRAGKTGLKGFFVGQCMKETGGQGNPKVIDELLAAKMDG